MLLFKTKVAPSSISGFGLMAAQFIPRGTPVWTLLRWFDLILTREQVESLPEPARERYHNYDYRDMDSGDYILCADEARFLNHSETPNIGWVSSSKYAEEGVDVALRDIKEGEEITINYKNYDADWPYKLGGSFMDKYALAGLLVALTIFAGCKENTSGNRRSGQLNLYIWSAYVTPEVLKTFQKKTGIVVRYDTYDSNEALLEKLQSGASDYDVVVPTNDIVTTMVRLNLLEKLDANRLPNLKNIASRFRDPAFDPHNEHSVPFVWGTTGIGYNKTKVTEPVDSWSILWNPKYTGRILMLDDPWECFGTALKLQGHSINSADPTELQEARNLLLQQKPLVKMYNSANFDEILLSGDVWLAQGWSGQFARARDQDPNISFVIPKEGSAVWIDCLAIPKSAPNIDAAHAFLNFCMEGKIAAEITNATGYPTANDAAKAYIKPEILNDEARFPGESILARCEWFRDRGVTSQILDQYWTEIKSH